MKLICLATYLIALIIPTRVLAQPSEVNHSNHVSILSMRNEVFYFKVDADFIGATVEVYDSTGAVFFTTELHTKRNLIDLFELENGMYTIHFENKGITEEFQIVLDKKGKTAKSSHVSTFKVKA